MAAPMSAFESLPTEAIQKIAIYSQKDDDLFSLICTCKRFYHALSGEESYVWRGRFLKLYDRPLWLYGENSKSLTMVAYQKRSRVFRTGAHFHDVPGQHFHINSYEWLTVVRTLILEAYDFTCNSPPPGNNNVPTVSKNFDVLRDLFKTFKFFDRCTYKWKADAIGISGQLYDAIQLILTPFALDIDDVEYNVSSNKGRLDYEVRHMYRGGMPTPFLTQDLHPDLTGEDRLFEHVAEQMKNHDSLYLFRILEIRNFWKRHLCFQGENTCFNVYRKLPKPQMFDGPLTSEFQPLGRRWEGFWANPGPNMNHSLAATGGNQMWMEEIEEMGPPRMWFDLTPGRPTDHWFSDRLKSASEPIFSKAPPNRVFTGHGRDIYGPFSIVGVVTPLLSQERIPGWHHIFMLKHYVDQTGFTELCAEGEVAATGSLNDVPDHEVHQWRLSGVVFPGSKVMLGWWDMDRGADVQLAAGKLGPWIMWWAEETPAWLEKTVGLKKEMLKSEGEPVAAVPALVLVTGAAGIVGGTFEEIDGAEEDEGEFSEIDCAEEEDEEEDASSETEE